MNFTNKEQEALDTLEEFIRRVEVVNLVEGLHLNLREAKDAYETLLGEKVSWQVLD